MTAFSCSPRQEAPVGASEESEAGRGGDASLVATVNGQPIYSGFYQQSLTQLRDKLAGKEDSVSEYLNAKFEALDILVDNELIHQESARSGVRISDSEVYAELDRIGKGKGGTEEFMAFMLSFGLTQEQVIEGLRKRLAVDKHIDGTIVRHIVADDSEVRAFYDENRRLFETPLSVRVSHILIRCGRDAPPDQARKLQQRAQEILDNIRGGGSFVTLAREYSEDNSAVLDGDIGFVTKGTTFPELEAAAFDLAPGTVGEVVRTDAGFHVIMVTERQGGTVEPFEKVQDVCRSAVIRNKRNKEVRALVNRLRSSAVVDSYLQ